MDKRMSHLHRYSLSTLLQLRPDGSVDRPMGLVKIILKGKSREYRRRKPRGRRQQRGRKHSHSKKKNSQAKRKNWRRPEPLKSGENSFAVARLKKQEESVALIKTARGILNKVTDQNMDVIVSELLKSGIVAYARGLDNDEQEEEFLQSIAKLFVQKSQIDHTFAPLYVQIADVLSKELEIFGDVLYEECRESIPTTRYAANRKRGYLGALLMLVELRRVGLIETGAIEVSVDRLFGAINRCDPTAIMGTNDERQSQSEEEMKQQIEVCIELICKFFPSFLAFESPSWAQTYLEEMRELQKRKDIIKPRSRFMMMDFFEEIKKD